MKVRKHVYFSGTVQGVGFRYRSYYIAQSLDLTGWVQNLWDDRVEMEIQGEEERILSFFSLIHKQRFIDITDVESEDIPVKPDEFSFQISG